MGRLHGKQSLTLFNREPYYSNGLHFSCTRCSECCRFEPGFVFLSEIDLDRLARRFKMEYTSFIEGYCRWVPAPEKKERLSLKEKANLDCIFWDEGCTVYESRPLQCSSFPFWESVLLSRMMWKNLQCPGVGKGDFHSREEIEACLERQKAEPVLVRKQ